MDGVQLGRRHDLGEMDAEISAIAYPFYCRCYRAPGYGAMRLPAAFFVHRRCCGIIYIVLFVATSMNRRNRAEGKKGRGGKGHYSVLSAWRGAENISRHLT